MRTLKCGPYMIQAGAFRLPGRLWQPRLTMTRILASGIPARSQAFPGLSPAFDSPQDATRFALELGRQLATERSSRLTV